MCQIFVVFSEYLNFKNINGVKILIGLHKWFKPFYGRDDLVKQNELGHMSETNVNVEGHT